MRKTFNHIINFFWSIIAFYPLISHWYVTKIDNWFILGISASILLSFLPEKCYAFLQLSDNRNFYEKLGVRIIRKFVQNGDLAKKMPDKKEHTIIESNNEAKKYLLTIAMYERFHWACFSFFIFSAIHAFCTVKITIAVIILAVNILYNVSAILLQQYNKIRIRKILLFT